MTSCEISMSVVSIVTSSKLDVREAAARLPEETEEPETMDEELEENAVEEVTGEDNFGDHEEADTE
jgi:hypothetical protein